MIIRSKKKQKILLLLAGGAALCLNQSSSGYSRILKKIYKNWQWINKAHLYRCVEEFRNDRLVSYQENQDGTTSIVLTEKGKKIALRYNTEKIKIKKPLRWDKKWRIIIFDIPEKNRSARDIFRDKLKTLNFYELQKSVFVHPYNCVEELNFLVEFYGIRNNVYLIEATRLSNEEKLKLHFKINK